MNIYIYIYVNAWNMAARYENCIYCIPKPDGRLAFSKHFPIAVAMPSLTIWIYMAPNSHIQWSCALYIYEIEVVIYTLVIILLVHCLIIVYSSFAWSTNMHTANNLEHRGICITCFSKSRIWDGFWILKICPVIVDIYLEQYSGPVCLFEVPRTPRVWPRQCRYRAQRD